MNPKTILNWLSTKRKTEVLPDYSRLNGLPSPDLPDEPEAVDARREAIEQELLDTARRSPADAPLLTEVLIPGQGPLTIHGSDGTGCLLTFGTTFRAADYFRTLLAPGPRVQYVRSSPSQLVGLLGELRGVGVDGYTIDRCARCPPSTNFTKIGSDSMRTPADVVKVWAIGQSIQAARIEFYVGRALGWARDGRLDAARDLALASVGHVYFEDPRPHLLLGQLAVLQGDRVLLEEAKTCLHYFGFVSWERKLEDVERLGTCDFSGPE